MATSAQDEPAAALRSTRVEHLLDQSPGRALARAVRIARTAVDATSASGLTIAGLAIALPGLVETGRRLLRSR